MKRTLKMTVALIMGITVSALSACGGGGTNGGGTGGTDINNINYKGTININLPTSEFNYEDTALKAVAAAYKQKHPETEIVVEQWTSSTYKDSLDSQFAGGASVSSADIVQTLLISNTYLTNKLVDFTPYLVSKNPYAGDTVWKDALDEEAYPLSLDRSGIYSINYLTSQSFFFYNKNIWRQAGLVNADGTDKIPATWDELVNFCAEIKNKTSVVSPISISGATYTTGAMSWLLNMYADQYYRSAVVNSHAIAGDYCYDPDIDAAWTYNVADKNNDSPSKYTLNSLRFYKAMMDNDISPTDAKYKAMLNNFRKIIPAYVQNNFASEDHYKAFNRFWDGDAAIVFNTTDFFNTYKSIFADGGMFSNPFEVGFFKAPPMTGTGDSAPDGSSVRSVGGAVGYYGVVKKDKAHNDLVMDFMMFWGSEEGQNIYNQSLKNQNAYISGASLIKGVDTPIEILPTKDYEFPGLCHNNPMGQFFGNIVSMNGAQSATQAYEAYTKNFFIGSMSIDDYTLQLQRAIKQGIPQYFSDLGWRSNAYETPRTNPSI